VTLIAVLDYGIGNLRSAQKALEHVGADARLTDDPGLVRDADAVVLPGVGAFGRCIEAVREHRLDDVVLDAIASGRPFLGICIGMQMLYESSDEAPGVPGLGVLPGRIRLLPDGVKRPQMQWNVLELSRSSEMLDGLEAPVWVYFVHSFAPQLSVDVVATCDYGGPVTAAVERGNLWATQFHPEKSGAVGLGVMANFVRAASGVSSR
jgi:imidazole glycerol-phosphate synthase subunit HisH